MALQYPINNDDKWRQTFIQFQTVTSTNTSNESVNTVGENVVMYLPSGFTIPGSVNYDNTELGVGGALAIETMETVGALFRGETSLSGIVEGLSEGWGNNINKETVSNMAQRMALYTAGQGAAADYVSQTSINPNIKVLFKSVSARQFNFTFTMIPTSSEEAQVINKIIQTFRRSLYPTVFSESVGWLYRFPDKFNIIISTNPGGTNTEGDITLRLSQNNLIKFKPSFLSDVNVTYNPNQSAWHEDGNPLETTMTLSFIEEETLIREDVERKGH